ncbi:hypothetical protein BpHYR1_043485, partial [Brachionus plicatilis]
MEIGLSHWMNLPPPFQYDDDDEDDPLLDDIGDNEFVASGISNTCDNGSSSSSSSYCNGGGRSIQCESPNSIFSQNVPSTFRIVSQIPVIIHTTIPAMPTSVEQETA